MNVKFCDVGRHTVDKLWYARTKSRPSCCQRCLPKLKSKPTGDDNASGISKYPEQKKRPQIAQFSAKKLKELAEYRPLRDKYLAEHPVCEAKVEGVCIGGPTQLHHKKPRQFYLCDVSIFIAVCQACHDWIEPNDAEARERGFKLDHLGDKK